MKDLPCQKRRHVVIRSKDGDKSEEHRCANGVARNYRKTVNEITCQNCVLRQPLVQIAPVCKEHSPTDAIWPEPYYGEGGDMIYPFQDGAPLPPVPQGYRRKTEEGVESWRFITEWEPCSYRQVVSKRATRGDVKVTAYCMAKNNAVVKHDECKQCLADIDKIGGDLNAKTVEKSFPLPEEIERRLKENGVPSFPGAGQLLDNYWKAVQGWVLAGRPTRNDLEVQKIHEEFCAPSPTPCDWYDPDSKRCKGCGCKVKPAGAALLNKIRMRTQHCPKGLW